MEQDQQEAIIKAKREAFVEGMVLGRYQEGIMTPEWLRREFVERAKNEYPIERPNIVASKTGRKFKKEGNVLYCMYSTGPEFFIYDAEYPINGSSGLDYLLDLAEDLVAIAKVFKNPTTKE